MGSKRSLFKKKDASEKKDVLKKRFTFKKNSDLKKSTSSEKNDVLKKKAVFSKFKLFQKVNIFERVNILRNVSIFKKIIFSFLGITIVTLLIINVIVTANMNSQAKKQFIASTNEVLDQNKNYVDYIVATMDNYAMQLSSNQEFVNALSEDADVDAYGKLQLFNKQTTILRTIAATNPNIASIYVMNPNGTSYGYPSLGTGSIKADDISGSELYKILKEENGRRVWFAPHDDANYSASGRVISSNRLIGVGEIKKPAILTINIKPEIFQKALENVKFGEQGYMYILDESGNVVSHKANEALGQSWAEKEVFTSMSGERGDFAFIDPDTNTKMLAVYNTSPGLKWKYVAVVPYSELTSSAKTTTHMIIVLSILCFILTLFTALSISLSISRPIDEIIKVIHKVEAGELNAKININSKNELGVLANSFNKMVNTLKKLVSEVKTAVDNNNQSTEQIAVGIGELLVSTSEVYQVSEQIAQGASTQAERSSDCSQTAEGFGDQLEKVVIYSDEVTDLSGDAKDRASEGMELVKNLKIKSAENLKTTSKLSNSINELSQSTKEVQGILTSISSISEQTNLLALNAAIEAARAGAEGRGFAVVAEEVRKLAEETKNSTEQIAVILKNINARTKESVNMSQNIISEISKQDSEVEDTLQAFSTIKESVDNVELRVTNLKEALDKLKKEKDSLVEFISDISAISEETSASTEEVNASMEQQNQYVEKIHDRVSELMVTSERLSKEIDKFKID
ncbi:methyl-accepting chemotaxis protein [Clostridium cellulovorans]|uniref:Methyl-accepting chemotaxis sensory transducer with Cache sensor n=1 Tax=Clostridium cellulovorans (strain ATCC 35296 / DSM 3052 / OCM 3 / 743B) TaxID=573061 RepID=D9SVS2_CLOC7|nr:methyl-accepting chemotaxis protein [Clostridium cellulovorans]ADL53133.1 methyl-accepting chemotaxis sensory transducer with Cache sensor [Clostridium cellulovorans 743B]